MRAFTAVVAILHFLTFVVSAHPFIIVHTKVTELHTTSTTAPTHHYAARGNILSDIASGFNSVFGVDQETTTTKKSSATATKVTLPPPAVVSATTDSEDSEPTFTSDSNDDDQDDDQSTSTEESSSTENSSTSTSTTESSTTVETTTTSSTESTPSATPVPSPTLGSSQASATVLPSQSENDNDGSGISPGGVAAAVIMLLLVVAATAFLVFKFHPKSQAWWAARQQREYQERSYRDAIDGPNAGSPNLRQEALGEGSAFAARRRTLKSFFAPKTVNLGGGKEIKRKPVNWGADSSKGSIPPTPKIGESDTEKIVLTASAAPMGQIERYSLVPQPAAPAPTSAVSPVSLRAKESLERLPPISPLSTHQQLPSISGTIADRDLSTLPPVPSLPQLIHAKRGSDGVFRLT